MASEQCDPVLAALHLAAEDDAFVSRSTVPLPVVSFSKRLDDAVARAQRSMEPAHSAQSGLDRLTECLFGALSFQPAKTQFELYSPYRIYMHKVADPLNQLMCLC